MKVIALIATLFILSVMGLYGQNTDKDFTKCSILTNLGYAVPLWKLKTGHITDNLIDYDDQYFYWQFVTINYYFKKEFGMSLSIQGNKFTDADKRGKSMDRALAERFGDDYFISTSPYSYGQSANMNVNLYVGFLYAKQFKRFSLAPKLQIGVTSFFTNRLNVYLKQKNSNKQLHITYDFNSEQRPKDCFTIMPGFMAGFQLAKHLVLDINMQASIFRTKFKYTQETRDSFTEEKSYDEFSYNKYIGTCSIGLGLGYRFD